MYVFHCLIYNLTTIVILYPCGYFLIPTNIWFDIITREKDLLVECIMCVCIFSVYVLYIAIDRHKILYIKEMCNRRVRLLHAKELFSQR